MSWFSPETLEAILPFIAIGFGAQLVDGALGMAFGLINSTLLITVMGLPPAVASASVHAVETFTTAASGGSHIVHRNVDWRLFRRLVIPGVLGGILGAYVLANIDASVARPFVMAYLAAIGLYLLYRAWRGAIEPRTPKVIEPLGFAGGFLDAAGGGGWGPVVTSNLLVQGASPRQTIGTVNTSEFFLTATISATFIAQMGLAAFTLQTAGLLIGGLVAAPLGGILAKRVPARGLMAMVGTLLTLTSAWSIYQALNK
ncbi:sulfite exporter TauE/SafE family protein [Sphingomonas sp. AR_OL41]|uniref:sulfite exporter TauE/SafE family protein n=1 Tax=Sphingomonas sp. AR_OL41 TaxID=3042729 RepID=UPI00248193F1|nr:sulfite exporter TauE/SafE family protein [Sphingomonas sp. AR_OL41]MDH7973021.1 sulfite exporter TauE/SafE family protein [Sphingomonas sp. AR_OL41]